MGDCFKSEGFISKKVFVSGQESAINLEDYKKIGFLPRGGTIGQVIVKCSNKDYHVKWEDNIHNIILENSLFVAENGNDSTGTRTRLDLPYLTINAAMNDALEGDTVFVYPGSYTVNTGETLLKAGVNLYLESTSVIVITDPTDSTMSIKGKQGIYGEGELVFISTGGIITITPSITPALSYANFIMEGTVLVMFNVNIQWEILNNLHIRFDEVRSSGSSCLLYNGSGTADGDGLVEFTVGELTITDSEPDATFVLDSLLETAVAIKIKQMSMSSVSTTNGVFNFINNQYTSSITIGIDRLEIDVNSQAQAEAPLLFNNNCEAVKNIKISTEMANPILLNGPNLPLSIERGKINISGRITALPAGVLYSWIDFTKDKQDLVFELDLLDETTVSFGGALATSSLLNLSSMTGRQRISGRILTDRQDLLDSLMVYGEYNLTTYNAAAILENFTIATTIGAVPFSLRKINALTTASVRCKGAYTNCVEDAVTNGGTSTLIDGLVVDADVL